MSISFRIAALLLLTLLTGPTGAENPQIKLSRDEQKVFELTNRARQKMKLPALRLNPLLVATARAHSANMAKQGKMEHTLDGKDVFARLDDAKYIWRSAGENIATGRRFTAEEIFRDWMRSKGHRANILEKRFQEIGVGIADDGKGNVYYTQVFGRTKKKDAK
jgi:uncharacterized protein YkwD